MAAQCFVLLMALIGAATCLILKRTVFVDLPLSWTDALFYCRQHYVDLSSTLSAMELDQMQVDIAVKTGIRGWIGLRKSPNNMSYTQWSDGYTLTFTSWAPGEPADPALEHCITTLLGKWIDNFCFATCPFFCYEWDPAIILVKENKTWAEALEHCRTNYTDLISLSNDTDLLAIQNLTIQAPYVWVGLHFLDGTWFWVNNEPLGSFVSVPVCPAKAFSCGAKKTGSEVIENIDCNMKTHFLCYHKLQ